MTRCRIRVKKHDRLGVLHVRHLRSLLAGERLENTHLPTTHTHTPMDRHAHQILA